MSTRNITKVLKSLTDASLSRADVKSIIQYYMGNDYAPVDDHALFNDFYRAVVIDKQASAAVLRGMLKALPVIMRHFYSSTSELTFYKKQRAELKRLYPKSVHTAIDKLRMSKAHATEIKTAYNEKLVERNEHRAILNASDIYAAVSSLTENNPDNVPYKYLEALLIATGSRPNEIIMTSTYKAVDATHFEQSDISRIKPGQAHINSVVRPTMGMSTAKMLKTLETYRSHWAPYIAKMRANGRTDDDIVRLILLRSNKNASDPLRLNKTLSFYRKVYANLAEAIRPDKNEERIYYIGRILGHTAGDATTAHAYSVVQVINDL